MLRLFSKRHQKAILEKTLKVSIPRRLRGRIWMELRGFDDERRTSDGGFFSETSVLENVSDTLKRIYGTAEFTAFDDNNNRVSVDLEGLVRSGWPSQVLDVLEACWDELAAERATLFQQRVNAAFEEERCPWRTADGTFFKVDSEFLERHVLAAAHEALASAGFRGAQDEFVEARSDLSAGEYKDAIIKACKSLESVLKVLTGRKDGTASELARVAMSSPLASDLPEPVRPGLADAVILGLPFLRNKLAGHGQGADVVAVPRCCALLAVQLAAVLNSFLIERYLAGQNSGDAAPSASHASEAPPPDDEGPPF